MPFPFPSTATSLPPSIPPSSFHSVCSPIYPSHSLSHDLMINYGCEFENKSFFANQNEISPHSRNYSVKMMLLMSFCWQVLARALIWGLSRRMKWITATKWLQSFQILCGEIKTQWTGLGQGRKRIKKNKDKEIEADFYGRCQYRR